MFDWSGDDVPVDIIKALEFFMLNILCLNPDEITPVFNKDTLTIDINGHIINVPMKLRERINK